MNDYDSYESWYEKWGEYEPEEGDILQLTVSKDDWDGELDRDYVCKFKFIEYDEDNDAYKFKPLNNDAKWFTKFDSEYNDWDYDGFFYQTPGGLGEEGWELIKSQSTESLGEDYYLNSRKYSDQLFEMIEDGVLDAEEIVKDLIYWCSEEDIKKYMKVNGLMFKEEDEEDEDIEDEDIDDYPPSINPDLMKDIF